MRSPKKLVEGRLLLMAAYSAHTKQRPHLVRDVAPVVLDCKI